MEIKSTISNFIEKSHRGKTTPQIMLSPLTIDKNSLVSLPGYCYLVSHVEIQVSHYGFFQNLPSYLRFQQVEEEMKNNVRCRHNFHVSLVVNVEKVLVNALMALLLELHLHPI